MPLSEPLHPPLSCSAWNGGHCLLALFHSSSFSTPSPITHFLFCLPLPFPNTHLVKVSGAEVDISSIEVGQTLPPSFPNTHLVKVSGVEVDIGGIEVGQRVLGIQLDGSLIVPHGIDAVVHELVDDTTVGEHLGSGRLVDGGADVLEGSEGVAHLQVDDGAPLQCRLEV